MRLQQGDPLLRMAAADPARHVVIDEAQRANVWRQIIEARELPAVSVRSRSSLRVLTLVVPLALMLTAAALAAGGLLRLGAPAQSNSSLRPLPGGGLVKGTVRLLPIATPDPVSGPPWGLRVLSTKFGEGCVQVGRLLYGRLGAIGQDSAFSDDDAFHAFPLTDTYVPSACTVLDGHGRIFLNASAGDVPASAWLGFGSENCVPSTATAAERVAPDGKPYPLCPQDDERDLFYGLLGPDAKSVTYALNGKTRTQPTVGAEGAYLIVTTASPTQLLHFSDAQTQDVVPVDGPITELHYRNGATCHLTSRSWIGGRDACAPTMNVPVGWVAPKPRTPTAEQAATPLHVRLLTGSHGHREIVIRFTARVPVTNARREYQLVWRQPGMGAQVHGYERTQAKIVAGQTVTQRIGKLGPALAPGRTSGTVYLLDATGAGVLEEGPGTVRVPVGSFSVQVP